MLQPHSGSWLVNAQWKLEDLAVEISMDFHCQPWTLSLIDIIAVLFTTGLASVTPEDWGSGAVPGILQARTLEWVAISFSRGSSRPKN